MSTPGVSHPSPTTAEDFRRVLDERAVQPVFQPVVDLDKRHVLGYEALARGPMGSALESPAALFGAAWRAGRVGELDWACRATAFWSRCACSWSTRAWTRPSPTCCWPASSRPTSSPRPPAAATSSWPPGRRSPAPSATACRWPVAGVRGADLAADDPLRQNWDLVVIGPRFAAALVARDRGDGGPDEQRRFDVVVTHDRDLVIRAAEPLLRRLVPER